VAVDDVIFSIMLVATSLTIGSMRAYQSTIVLHQVYNNIQSWCQMRVTNSHIINLEEIATNGSGNGGSVAQLVNMDDCSEPAMDNIQVAVDSSTICGPSVCKTLLEHTSKLYIDDSVSNFSLDDSLFVEDNNTQHSE